MPRDRMTRSLVTTAVMLLSCAMLGGFLWCGVSAYAQLSGLGSAEGFDANEYYEAPDHTKLKWRITGAKAQPKERSLMLLSGMQLQMFAKTGERQLVVDAPECLYDPAKRTASFSPFTSGSRAFATREGTAIRRTPGKPPQPYDSSRG